MSDDFKVISEFCCDGKPMVTVRTGSAAHVMSQEEWHKVYGRNHQEKWKTKIDRNRFTQEDEYKLENIS